MRYRKCKSYSTAMPSMNATHN